MCFSPLFTLHVFAALQEWHLRGVCLVHILGYFMPCFDKLLTIHPAYLWARETLILVLKL